MIKSHNWFLRATKGAFFGLVLFNPGLLWGATYYVENSASCLNSGAGSATQPFCTIGTAAARVNAGDTVIVKPGSYPERVKISGTRPGTSALPITFTAQGTVIVGAGQAYGFDLSGAQWVTVQGFTVGGTSPTTSHGIKAALCSNVTLANNQVVNAQGVGIYVKDSSQILLAGNRVEGSVSRGIELNNSKDITVSKGQILKNGSRASGLTAHGIYVSGSSGSSRITEVESYDNSEAGIYLTNGTTGFLVKSNILHDNARGYTRAAAGIETRSTDNIIEANISYKNEDSGINIRNGGDRTLAINNVAFNNGDHGIDTLASTSVQILYNSVSNNVTAGLNVEGNSGGATIANNVSVDNGINSPRTDGNIRVDDTSSAATQSDYNIVYLSTAGAGKMYNWNSIYFTSLDSLHIKFPNVEINGRQADPKWVGQASGNFLLKAGSPAIDSANSGLNGAPTKDAAGNARGFDDPATPNTGTGPRVDDRGAFEFGSSKAPAP